LADYSILLVAQNAKKRSPMKRASAQILEKSRQMSVIARSAIFSYPKSGTLFAEEPKT
jgi:hypothetical protein